MENRLATNYEEFDSNVSFGSVSIDFSEILATPISFQFLSNIEKHQWNEWKTKQYQLTTEIAWKTHIIFRLLLFNLLVKLDLGGA